jgi:hypothetical protein
MGLPPKAWAMRWTTTTRAGSPEMEAAVDAAAGKIIAGELIVVHDYMSDNACPAASF